MRDGPYQHYLDMGGARSRPRVRGRSDYGKAEDSVPKPSPSRRSGSSCRDLVQRLLAYPDLVKQLVKQTAVNTKKQFMESQDFQAAVTEAVVDN